MDPVLIRHEDVGDDKIETSVREHLDPLDTVARCSRGVSIGFDRGLYDVSEFVVVINDEYVRHDGFPVIDCCPNKLRRPKGRTKPGDGMWSPVLLGLGLTLSLSCSSDPVAAPSDLAVVVSPARDLAVGIGASRSFTADVRSPEGQLVMHPIQWFVLDTAIAVVDQSGRITARAGGSTLVVAVASDAPISIADLGAADGSGLPEGAGRADLEVYLPPTIGSYEPGVVYRGRAGYTEYIPGRLPVILAASHGGLLSPSEVRDRTLGVTATDRETQDVLRRMASELEALLGERPHTVVSHLRRLKLDPNREVSEAAQGDPFAERAWEEYHGFIDVARGQVQTQEGRGLFVDVHGHGHAIQRLEWGYLLSAIDLDGDASDLNRPSIVEKSSLRDLAGRSLQPFSEIIRGAHSMGGLMAQRGVRGVPSPAEPSPGSDPYFRGGYSTRRHGSRDGGTVSGLQVELNWIGRRETPEGRQEFAEAFAEAVVEFLDTHLGPTWRESW